MTELEEIVEKVADRLEGKGLEKKMAFEWFKRGYRKAHTTDTPIDEDMLREQFEHIYDINEKN